MSEEQKFLAAIRDSPEDDAPRLVYADWLLERGDARGEFIVAQCARAKHEAAGDRTSDPYRRAVVAESLALTPARKAWFRWLNVTDKRRSGFERGLPCTLHLTRETLIASWPMLAQVPLRAVVVPAEPLVRVGDLRPIAKLPGLTTLEAVELETDSAVFGLDPKKLVTVLEDSRVPSSMHFHASGQLLPNRPFAECAMELWHSTGANGEPPPLRLRPTDRLPPDVDVFCTYSQHDDVRAVIGVLGPGRRAMRRLAVTFQTSESFGPLFDRWTVDGLQRLDLGTIEPRADHDTNAFAVHQVGKGLTSFETTIPFDEALARGLRSAKLGTLAAHGGGSLTALERVLTQPIHTLSLRGFPSAELIDLLLAKAPPTLAMLTFWQLESDQVMRLAHARFSQLTRLWVQFSDSDAPALLDAPELAGVPWIHCSRTNRFPARNANPYAFRRPRR